MDEGISTLAKRVLKTEKEGETVQLSQRKKEILKAVIDLFITTGEPVGSKAVMDQLSRSCSSATIRNEMAALEKLELLEQPHTSAGRIPTGRGYKLYVDTLMEDYHLSFEETLLFQSLLSDVNRDTDLILSDMTKLLSRMTGYAVLAVAGERVGTIERFEGVYVSPQSFLLIMITSTGKAFTRQLNLEIPTDPEGVAFIVGILNDHLTKKELGGVTLERMLAMERDMGDYRGITGPLIRIIYEMMDAFGRESLTVKGLAKLTAFPEFGEEGALTDLLCALEDEKALLDRFRESDGQSMHVHIGSEEETGLDRTSYVSCPFRLGKTLTGTVCVIGPKRMNYAAAMAKLEYLSKQIHAAHGFEPNLPLIETKDE